MCTQCLRLNAGRRQADDEVGGRRRRTEEMSADGDEVNGGADEDEAVPDGVRERHDAVTLEEHDADHVDDAAGGQLGQPGHLLLHRHARIPQRP